MSSTWLLYSGHEIRPGVKSQVLITIFLKTHHVKSMFTYPFLWIKLVKHPFFSSTVSIDFLYPFYLLRPWVRCETLVFPMQMSLRTLVATLPSIPMQLCRHRRGTPVPIVYAHMHNIYIYTHMFMHMYIYIYRESLVYIIDIYFVIHDISWLMHLIYWLFFYVV